jgi:glycosyltransferase involved in cell wall biosynthesis
MRSWLVLRDRRRLRWGGDLRRRHLLENLIQRTKATTVETWEPADIIRGLRPRWALWREPPSVVSAELVGGPTIDAIRRRGDPLAVDLHDDPTAFAIALGLPPDPETRQIQQTTWEANLRVYRNYILPTRAMADLFGLDPDRVILAPNGTDADHIKPLPFPDLPAVGLASGAAPGRGIELLIDATRMARKEIPGLRLMLWLVATGPASLRYLESIPPLVAGDDWIEVSTTPYAELPSALGRATVLCIPHPPNSYFDTILPIKLTDYMAAGRPIVATPRSETARILREHAAGITAPGDRVEDLATALRHVLLDSELAHRLAANGRRAAVEVFDWRVVGSHLTDELLRRAG